MTATATAAPTAASLRTAVKRASRKLDRITQQYGANDIPATHPLHVAKLAATQEYRAALLALLDAEAA